MAQSLTPPTPSSSLASVRHGWRQALGFCAVAAVATTIGCTVWRLRQAAELVKKSKSFKVQPADTCATLLIVGDSSAVGTGASAPALSLAGQLSQSHPQLAIVNLARDGARFADVSAQLDAAAMQPRLRVDAVLLLAGGNDVIRLTREAALKSHVERAMARATRLAPLVVAVPSGNIGNAPFFAPPVSWWMSARTRMVHRRVRLAAAASGARFVDLYRHARADPFAQRPRQLMARDGLHPSDAGYALWLAEINAQSGFSKALMALTQTGRVAR